jgi:hypothetical protein
MRETWCSTQFEVTEPPCIGGGAHGDYYCMNQALAIQEASQAEGCANRFKEDDCGCSELMRFRLRQQG